MADGRGVGWVMGAGAGLALVGLVFPPLLELTGASALASLVVGLATGATLGTSPSGMRILDAARQLEGGWKDAVVVSVMAGATAAVLVLLSARVPRLGRLFAYAGLAAVGAIELAPRIQKADARGWLASLVAQSDPGVGYYVALAGFGIAILAGTLGGLARTGPK